MIQGAIFDMDGLMFDTERMWQTFWAPVLSRRGIEYIPEQGLATAGCTGAVMAAKLREWYGDDLDAEQVWEETKQLAHETFMSAVVPKCPGLDELMAWLGAHDVPCAVASSSDMTLITHHLDAHGMRDQFAALVTGAEVKNSKPAPDVFLVAADKIGTEPAHTLVLEDSFNGVRAGAAGGFITAMVPSVVPPDDEMRAKATVICKDLTELRDLLEAGKLG
jgi:HAD superfamily hydrolase (TIGR01509 family)